MVRPIPDTAGGLLSYFTRHKTLANLVLALALIAGLAAVPNMRLQFFPDIVLENINVGTNWEGASAEDVDRAIVQLLEPALAGVDGIERTSSRSLEGEGHVWLTFRAGWDMDRAMRDVQEAVNSVTDLPEDAEEPNLWRSVWRDRVTDVVVTGPVNPEQLGRLSDELVQRLFVAGVTETEIRGVVAAQTVIEVSSVNLIRYDLSLSEISEAIAAEMDASPAGDVSSSNTRVRTGTGKRSPDQIETIVLKTNEDGSKLTVGDIATIQKQGSDRGRSYFVDGNPAVSIEVKRSAEGDAIALQRKVEEVVAEVQSTFPERVTAELIRTRSEAISQRLNILIENGLIGLGLVVTLLFFFLNARTAFWVAAGIPVAMSAAIAIMYAGGLTLNMISLFGLIITLGIVVDDAIVVGEHADYRARHFGETPMQAAENAARRMAMPVFAASITTVIAFAGLVVIGGNYGRLIQDIPLTVIAVLTASLIECFLVLPNHMAHALAAKAKERWYDWPSRQVNCGFTYVREKWFRPFIAGVIVARYAVLAAVVLVLASQLAVFVRGDVQWRFFNSPERGSVVGNFAMLESATRADSIDMMLSMQRTIESVATEYEEEYGANPVEFMLFQIGGNAGRGLEGVENKDKDLLGSVRLELIDAESRPYSSYAFTSKLEERIEMHPMAEVVAFRGTRSGPQSDSISVAFGGGSADALKAASLALQQALQSYPEVTALQDNLAYDKEEMILELTPKGLALGFTAEALGRSLRNRLSGIEAGSYPDGARSATIRVELPEGELEADFLERSYMRAPSGSHVPLADIVTVTQRTGFGTVRRSNGILRITVTGDISEENADRAAQIEAALRDSILPEIAETHKVSWAMGGNSAAQNSFLTQAATGFALCMAGIYLVLAWVFASWTRPFVVLAIIPFGLVGTIYGHGAWDVPLSMFTVVGLLGMTGIIINDSIVLVTTIDEYAERRGLIPSIVDGAADRLRPVFLTTMTTVLGLLPLLYETSRQAQFLKPTVIALVYGLGFGLVLVLLIVPALLAVQHDVSRYFTAARRGVTAPAHGLRIVYLVLGAVIVFWAATTFGAVALNGAMPETLLRLLPVIASMDSAFAALVVFLAGSVFLAVLGYIGLRFYAARRLRMPS